MATSTPRPRKTPAQRAQLDLDAAIKRRDAAQKRVDKLEESIAPARQELKEAAALADFYAQSPLLPQTQQEAEDASSDEEAPADA